MDKPEFEGLSDRELVKEVVLEMRRRRLLGCVYVFPDVGGAGVFGSSSPLGTMRDLSASQQLSIFAHVANMHLSEQHTALAPEGTPEKKDWIN